MCLASERNSHECARRLARLMEKELGYVEGHIDPVALRLFIQAKWEGMAPLAHAIHDDES